MIKAILVFNNHGKPRLTKFYQYFTESGMKMLKICYDFEIVIIYVTSNKSFDFMR